MRMNGVKYILQNILLQCRKLWSAEHAALMRKQDMDVAFYCVKVFKCGNVGHTNEFLSVALRYKFGTGVTKKNVD